MIKRKVAPIALASARLFATRYFKLFIIIFLNMKIDNKSSKVKKVNFKERPQSSFLKNVTNPQIKGKNEDEL